MSKAVKYNVGKIASTLKAYRAKHEMTREELSKKAKVNYNTIIKLESGANKNPTIKTLIGVASVFKCSIVDLIS